MKTVQVQQFPNLVFTEEVLFSLKDLTQVAQVKVLGLLGRLNTFGADPEYLAGLEIRGKVNRIKGFLDSQSIEIQFSSFDKQFHIIELSSIVTDQVIGI
jgi:hypothetical protein